MNLDGEMIIAVHTVFDAGEKSKNISFDIFSCRQISLRVPSQCM